jgi:hypothetical protein
MLTLLESRKMRFVATDDEARIARETAAKLEPLSAAGTDVELHRTDGGDDLTLEARVIDLIEHVLGAVANGGTMSFVPTGEDLAHPRMAVPRGARARLVGLLATDEIPHDLGGPQGDVMASDVVAGQCPEPERESAILDDACDVLFPEALPFGSAR